MTLEAGTEGIETARLVLRRIVADDLPFFTRIHADPDVTRYLGHGRPRTPGETLDWFEGTLETYEKYGLGQLAVVRKSDGVLVGRSGMSDLATEAHAVPGTMPRTWFFRATAPAGVELVLERELGYTFAPEHWGNGYASEAARHVFGYARDVLAVPRVVSLIHPGNVRSRRVAAQFGVQLERQFELMGQAFDLFAWPMSGSSEVE